MRYYRAGDKERAYEALGHVLHLLADMGAPERTHIIKTQAGRIDFQGYFSGLLKKNNGSLPWEYSVNAKRPVPVKSLKDHFDGLAKLPFGPMKDGGRILDFDEYYRAAHGDIGVSLKAPSDEVYASMGEYLLPRTIEYGAGLLERFQDETHLRAFVEAGNGDGGSKATNTGVTSTTTTNHVNTAPTEAANGAKQPMRSRGVKFTLERFLKTTLLKEPRSIAIHPIRPASGITTGVIMAYGHIIPPPYVVGHEKDRLFVNGVQVSPSLVEERHDREHPMRKLSPQMAEVDRKGGELILAARRTYEAEKGAASLDVIHAKILQLLRNHPDLIQNPRWQKEALCYSTPAYDGDMCDNFAAPLLSPADMESPDAQIEEAENRNVKMIEAVLREGDWVYFGSEGSWTDGHDVRSVVNEIMGTAALSRTQKIEALDQRVFHDFALAIDVADNYSAAEWHSAK